MALKQQQDMLARLYTDPALRSKFLDTPTFVGGELGLDADEAEDLASVASDEVRWFADSLLRKRLREVAKLLPLTKRAMGNEFDRTFLEFARSFNPTTVKKHLEDADAFSEMLGSSSSWTAAANIARWESARLRHNAYGRRVSFCFLRYDPRTLLNGDSAKKGTGFWIAVGERSRIIFR